jgi:dTDP-4-dehydrorhamnose reductase
MSARLVWITGAGGLIGSYFLRTAPKFASQWQARGLQRADVDLTDDATVRRMFMAEKPLAVIHCAALSKTRACQTYPELARNINVEATALLAELAVEIPFVFFSTDLVFDGNSGNYDELAAPNPLNVYARTKAEAEQVVLRNPRHTVIRTSLNGGVSRTGDRGFNEEMRSAWQAGRTLRLFTDEFRCPIAAAVTARAVWELLALDKPGLYHVAGSERLSRWQIGQLLAARWPDVPARREPASLKDYTGPRRAPDTSLNCAKVQALLSFRLPNFTEWLEANPNEPF